MTTLLLIVYATPTVAAGSIADDAVPYTFGETYSGSVSQYTGKTYTFNIEKKSNVYFELTIQRYKLKNFYLYNESGKAIMDRNDLESSKNEVTDTWYHTNTRILQPGQYYLKIETEYTAFCTLFITSEDAITLTKPTITKISSPITMYLVGSPASGWAPFHLMPKLQ